MVDWWNYFSSHDYYLNNNEKSSLNNQGEGQDQDTEQTAVVG